MSRVLRNIWCTYAWEPFPETICIHTIMKTVPEPFQNGKGSRSMKTVQNEMEAFTLSPKNGSRTVKPFCVCSVNGVLDRKKENKTSVSFAKHIYKTNNNNSTSFQQEQPSLIQVQVKMTKYGLYNTGPPTSTQIGKCHAPAPPTHNSWNSTHHHMTKLHPLPSRQPNVTWPRSTPGVHVHGRWLNMHNTASHRTCCEWPLSHDLV